MDLPAPTDAHRALERLAGHWEGTERFPPSPWAGEGYEATARIENRIAAGGFALVGDYQQIRDGKPTLSGHAVYVYDPEGQRYEQHWFDSLGSPPMVFRGRFEEGERLVLEARNDEGCVRATIDLSAPRRMGVVMEMSSDRREWITLFEGDYGIPGDTRP